MNYVGERIARKVAASSRAIHGSRFGNDLCALSGARTAGALWLCGRFSRRSRALARGATDHRAPSFTTGPRLALVAKNSKARGKSCRVPGSWSRRPYLANPESTSLHNSPPESAGCTFDCGASFP